MLSTLSIKLISIYELSNNKGLPCITPYISFDHCNPSQTRTDEGRLQSADWTRTLYVHVSAVIMMPSGVAGVSILLNCFIKQIDSILNNYIDQIKCC